MTAGPAAPTATGPASAADPRRRWPERASLPFDLAVAAVAYLTVTVGLAPWYSERLFDREAFAGYYDQGIYRFRIVGPEVVLWLERSVLGGDPIGSHLVVGARQPHAADLFTAIFLLNAVSLLGIVLLARGILRRARVPEPARSLVMVVLVVTLAASLSTVTPYDLPSLLLVLAILVVADRRPPWDLLAVPLVVLAVLTRESALIVVAGLVAHALVVPPSRRRIGVIVAVGIAGVAAYVGVRVGSSSPALWEALTIRGNLVRLIQWMGLGMMAATYLVWWRVCALAGLGEARSRRAVGWFWLLATPYVLTALLTGYWFEVRLLIPMVVVELWLRASLAQGQDTSSVQSPSPLEDSASTRSDDETTSTPAGSS